MIEGKTIGEWRTVRATYQAKLAQLDFEERSGKLIDADQVKREAFQCGRRVRDLLTAIPARISNELVSMTNQIEVENRLMEEIERALETLSANDDGVDSV